MNRPADEISLLQIVEAIDGLDIFDQCGIGFRKCNPRKPCPIHKDYKKIRDRVYKLFEEKTLVTVNEEIKNGESISEIIKPSK